MKQPERHKRAVTENKDQPSKEQESVREKANGQEKPSDTLSLKSANIIKKNSILPAKSAQNFVALSAIKEPTMEEADSATIESSPLSSKQSSEEKKTLMIKKAMTRKGNEVKRQSFHDKMNMYNMISSSLGLLSLMLQMVEVTM